MKVLLTGHKGYIGSVMVPFLQEAGHIVHGFDSDLFAGCSFDEQGMVVIAETLKDLRDAELHDLSGFDAVIHLANLSNDPLGNLDPDLTFAINHRATVRLAELAKEAGVQRFIFSSSCSLYGAAGQDSVTEEAVFNPVTPYGEAKVLAERDIRPLASDGFSPVFMRNATVYGLSPRLRFDLVVNNLTAWAESTGQIRMKSDGSPWRPLVHVNDVCTAFLAALEAPTDVVHNEAFNVGSSGENYQIRDVATIVGDVVPDCEVSFADGASPDNRSYRVSFEKIAERLNWHPEWTVRQGAQQIYEAIGGMGLAPEDFEGERYSRIAHLKSMLKHGRVGEDLRLRHPAAIDS